MSDTIRVMQVLDSLEISGGVQSVVMNVYRRMDREKVQFDFAVYDAPGENSYQPEIEALGGRVFPVRNLSAAGPAGFYRQFVRLFRSREWSAVHAHNLHHNGLILLAAKKAGIERRISHAHQSFDERNRRAGRKLLAGALKRLNNTVATRRIACSDLAGEFLYGRGKPFEFLPNAVDLSQFETGRKKGELRKQFPFLRENQTVLLHAGRFTPAKNQHMLVDIMNWLDGEDCVLLLVGDGPMKEKILGDFQMSGPGERVRYLGLRRDVPDLLGMADCLLLPSLHEGLPMVAVEAQAAGCPSLLSDRITRQADLGFGLVDYLPIDRPELWAEQIRRTIENRTSVPLDEIHRRMREMKFDTQTNRKAWYELYGIQG